MHTEFNRRLIQAKLRALATIEELCGPAEPQPGHEEAIPQTQDSALRLRAAITILKTRPIDLHGNPLPIAKPSNQSRQTDEPDAANPEREQAGQANETNPERERAGQRDTTSPERQRAGHADATTPAQAEYDGWRPWMPPSCRATASTPPSR